MHTTAVLLHRAGELSLEDLALVRPEAGDLVVETYRRDLFAFPLYNALGR